MAPVRSIVRKGTSVGTILIRMTRIVVYKWPEGTIPVPHDSGNRNRNENDAGKREWGRTVKWEGDR
ncbi:MAG: hypothetical protein QOG97_2844 [Acidimicrobiaceae bacterium]|nr:hypothetical protein [Acidimicrobiaceae bacterium]